MPMRMALACCSPGQANDNGVVSGQHQVAHDHLEEGKEDLCGENGSVATLSFLAWGYGLRWRKRVRQNVQGQAI